MQKEIKDSEQNQRVPSDPTIRMAQILGVKFQVKEHWTRVSCSASQDQKSS